MIATEFTLSEMILIAAHKLQTQGQTQFSAEELTVTSWKEFPDSFGLKGFVKVYPDSNRVLASIMGERGLVRRGWLMKTGQKSYSLSSEGLRMVRKMVEGDAFVDDTPPPARLPRDQERLLSNMLDSVVRQKVEKERGYDLSFSDALRFWGAENLHGRALDDHLHKVEQALEQAEELVRQGNTVVGAKTLTRNDLDLLRRAQYLLQERFAKHLSLVRQRTS